MWLVFYNFVHLQMNGKAKMQGRGEAFAKFSKLAILLAELCYAKNR